MSMVFLAAARVRLAIAETTKNTPMSEYILGTKDTVYMPPYYVNKI